MRTWSGVTLVAVDTVAVAKAAQNDDLPRMRVGVDIHTQPCFPAHAVPLGLGLERLHLRGHLFIHLLPHSARILDLALETSILHILRAFSSPTTDHLFFAENSNPCARQARQQPIHRPVAASVPCAVTAMSPMRWER